MVGKYIEVAICSLSYGGSGFAKTNDGKAVFVPYVIPGEIITAEIVREHSSYIKAQPKEIIYESPSRVKPHCDLFGVCGGCDWQHIRYSDQVKWKDEILKNSLRKIIDEDNPKYFNSVTSINEYGYRNQIRLQCSNASTGYYMKGTNKIVNINDCLLAEKKIRDILLFFINYIYNILRTNLLSLVINFTGNELQAVVYIENSVNSDKIKRLIGLCNDLGITGIITVDLASGCKIIIGDGCYKFFIETKERRFSIRGGLGGFIQANHYVNQSMVQHVIDLIKGSNDILELYCGSGNFTVPVATVCGRITAVDHDRRLLSHVVKNADDNDVNNVKAVESGTKEFLFQPKGMIGKYDTIIMDPPRTGAKDIIDSIACLNAGKIVYISCNPSTLSRDIKTLKTSGYKLSSLRMFDMFPQTYHIEAVACLEH